MVMAQDGVLCDPNLAADQFGCGCDLLMREIEHLLVLKFKGRRKIDGQVVAEPVLSERRAVPIGDLSARRDHLSERSEGHTSGLQSRGHILGALALANKNTRCSVCARVDPRVEE